MKHFFEANIGGIGEEFQSVSQRLLEPGAGGEITIDTPAHLFKADFVRDGSDLVLKNNGVDDIRIVDYFAQSTPADLITPNGARLAGQTVEKLAGPVAPGQYAQAGQREDSQPIGQVETVEGNAQVQRSDGTVDDLSVGMKVFQNDVVSTAEGGKLSVTFVDGTIFTLASSARMVLDELVYTPSGTDNSATFSLIEGSFVFVAGQVAKTGEMDVTTPSATMGIRGTTVAASIATVDGVLALTVRLVEDFDGTGTGVIQLFDLDGNLITTITATDTKWIVPINGDDSYEVRTADDDASDEALLLDAANAFAQAYSRVANGQSFVEQQSTTSTPSPNVDDAPTGLDGGNGDNDGGTTEGNGESDGGGGGTTNTGPTSPTETPGTDPTELDPNNGPANTEPDAPDTEVQTNEDNSIGGTIEATDADGDALTFTVETPPSNGTVTLLETGDFIYTPNDDFSGDDSFTYQVDDGNGGMTTGTVTLTVDPVNDAPTASDVEVFATEDNVFEGSVAGAATDADGDTLIFSVVTEEAEDEAAAEPNLATYEGLGPSNGVVIMQPDGTFTYTPDQNFSGTDSFDYQVTDPSGETSTGTITVTVSAVNDAPVAENANLSTDEDTVLTGNLSSFASDIDDAIEDLTFSGTDSEDDAALAFQALDEDGPQNGTVEINEDGTFTYTPDQDFNGTDSFDYQVTDPSGETSTGTVTITVTPVNDLPTANDLTVNGTEDDTISGTVTADDPDNDNLTFQVLTPPSNGTVVMNDDGTFTYTPDGDFNGTDTFSYQVTDGEFLDEAFDESVSQFGTVTVVVAPVNDAPDADDQFFEVPAVDDFDGQIEASDIDGDDLTFTLVTNEDDNPLGTLTVNEDGSFTYVPGGFGDGFDTFTVNVSDGTDTTSIEITFALEDDGGDEAEEFGLDVEFNLTADENAPAGSATVSVSEVAATPINIVFALDASGSFQQEFSDQIEAVSDTLTALQAQFQGSTTPVTVQLTVFNNSATNYGPFDLFDTGGFDDALETIEDVGAGGSTSWVAALNAADNFFDAQEEELGDEFGEAVNLLYLITDGQPTNSQSAIGNALANLQTSHNVNIQAFGIGSTFNPTLLEQTYTVDGVDYTFDSDGDAPVVSIVDEETGQNNLSEVLLGSAIFAAELSSFDLSLQADGVAQGVIADETSDAFEELGLNFLLSLAKVDGIEDLLGEINDLQAVAVFDTDGDLETIDDQVTVVSTVRIERPDVALDESGLSGADFLLGGSGDDTLSGNGGDDMLIGGGGQNELYGGAGNDTLVVDAVPTSGTIIDGGEGAADELNFTIGGDLTGILPTLTIRDIEAIEMENGVANSLTLTVSDISALSDTANSDLADLFEGYDLETDNTIMVFGDDNDTLNLSNPDGLIIASGSETNEDLGSFTLYSFFDGDGLVTAILAVDDDVNVTGAATLTS